MTTKICKKCNKDKDLSEFNKLSSSKDGHKPRCRECCADENSVWYKKNKEDVDKRNKEYKENHKEEEIYRNKIYYQNNKKRCGDSNRKYAFNRAREDINFRMRKNLRTRLYRAIKGGQKTGSAIGDLGCSIDELKTHIELKFLPGMTWDNYGKWHIDHIEPLCSFDLTDAEQLKSACNFSNLRPLWGKDNLLKLSEDKKKSLKVKRG